MRSWRRWAPVALVAVAATPLMFCSCAEHDSEPADAGDDAAAPDAGTLDAGAMQTDAGSPPRHEPQWESIPDLPIECDRLKRARHPERLLHAEWEPCADGRPGCEEMQPDRDHERYYRWRFAPRASGRLADGSAWTEIWLDEEVDSLRTGETTSERRRVIARIPGDALAAWWIPDERTTTCGIGTVAGERDELTYVVVRSGEVDPEWPTAIFYGSATRPYAADPIAVVRSADWGGGFSPNIPALGPDALAYRAGAGARTFIVHHDGAHEVRESATGGSISSHFYVGADLLWLEWGSETTLAHDATAAPETLLRVPDTDIRGPASDGETLAWVQAAPGGGVGALYTSLSLWAAPYTTDSGALAPRRVRDLPVPAGSLRGIGEAEVAGGVYAYAVAPGGDTGELLFIDVADGRMRRWVAPEGWQPGTPFIYFTGDEIVAVMTYQNTWLQQLVKLDVSQIPYVDE